MKLELIKPFAALNKAYRKASLNEDQIKLFKDNLLTLFNRINDRETEEHFKNIVSDFLKDTYYKGKHEVNTKGRQDLVIHTDKTSASNVGVIIEVKRPSNKLEMISKANPNAKALHELMHYYLQERYLKGNKEIKNLIVTNIYEWYIFDGADFERFFFDNKKLTKEYKNWNDGIFGVNKTDWFYQEVAKPFIETELTELPCTYFNLKEVEKVIKKSDKTEDKKLIDLFKILSSEHLLKKPFANDTNILNKDFYNELLHLLGLEETKETGKKLIKRKKEELRNEGSLLENTINILKTRNKLSAFENPKQFGENEEEQLFSLGLELCITWLNRILFLKLLEGQLIKYHKGDKAYSFLNFNRIKDFDELNELFFEVLAVPVKKRTKSVVDKFGDLPYLNSSLFEESDIERKSLVISDLKDRLKIPVLSATVLKEANGKKITGDKNTLQYLFEFLDAYNFESDSKAEIQTVSKTIINASVLGLIFEKINGYKDGSFFTPSFITMYMSRETIRRAIVQKFNEQYNWQCSNFSDLFNKLDKINLEEANATIDSLKVCDPAVGSGHFLVSALNEIITIKNDLEILTDAEGKRLRGYHIATENDELIITREEEHFVYNYKDKESQRIQETLFHEKQKIIENSLFGVDINPKSVMICRLRLWIELLKNMYYTQSSNYKELETLPNIDINIKCGNSLVYRFDIKDSFAKIPTYLQYQIKLATQKYKDQVLIYKSTSDKATKKLAEKNIAELKLTFAGIANPTDSDYNKWKEAEAKLGVLPDLFSREAQEEWKIKFEIITKEAKALKKKYEYKLETLYGNAFEWRFEFPEVLNEDGQFVGFDVVIGNPPYIYNRDISEIERNYYRTKFNLADDLYTYFLFDSLTFSKEGAYVSMITPNTYFSLSSKEEVRKKLLDQENLILTYSGFVFEDAYVETEIFNFCKPQKGINYSKNVEFVNQPNDYKNYNSIYGEKSLFSNNTLYRFFIPTPLNKIIFKKWGDQAAILYRKYHDKLSGKKIKNAVALRKYISSLKEGDFTFLGLISSGEQGLVTGNNSKYIANIIFNKNEDEKIKLEFLRQLNLLTKRNITLQELDSNLDEYYDLAEDLKKKESKPALFGKFFNYKGVEKIKVKNYNELTKEEKLNGCNEDLFVIYNRGNETGEKWIIQPKECISWSKKTVDELKEGTVTNSRWQGSNYFETTGFGWVDYFTDKIKSFFINEAPYSKNIVKFHTNVLTDKFIVGLLNSNFITYYVKNFITATHTLQINDGRLIPVIIPSKTFQTPFEELVDDIIKLMQTNPEADVATQEKELNRMVYNLYGISPEEVRIIEGEANGN